MPEEGNPFTSLGSADAGTLDANALTGLSPAPIQVPPPLPPAKEVSTTPGFLGADEAKKKVLDKIASGEAPDYNVLFGGHRFNSYSDHPNLAMVVPGKFNEDGTPVITHAAGRYQFQYTTWDALRNKLGLKDFSPASQDSAAWDLAATTYKKSTGRDLLSDAQKGDVQWSALQDQWPSLAKATPGFVTPDSPTSGGGQVEGKVAMNGSGAGGAGSSGDSLQGGGPSGQGQGQGNLLPLMLMKYLAPHLKFTPVEYDPYKVLGAGNG